MVLYQIFGADLKSNMAARVHNVFSLAEILKIFFSETTKPIELWLQEWSLGGPVLHIFIFFSETTKQIWTKLGRNVHWMVM